MEKVFIIQAMGVRQAALVDRRSVRGKPRAVVHVRGAKRPMLVDPRTVFTTEAEAREAWRLARAHRAGLELGGEHMTIISAHYARLDGLSRRAAA